MPVFPSVKKTDEELTQISRIEWARLAMAIDGEGAICILRSHKKLRADGYVQSTRHFLHVTVMNTSLALLNWCRDTFGGGIYVTATGNGPFVKRRECYAWATSSGYAEKIVRGCLEFFIIKRDQAELALRFQDTFKGSRYLRCAHNAVVGAKGWKMGQPTSLLPSVVEHRELLKQELSSMKMVM